MFDTTGQAMQFLSVMVPSTSSIVSISTMPSGTQLGQYAVQRPEDKPQIPWVASAGLNVLDRVSKMRAQRWGVDYQYMFLQPNGKDLAEIGQYAEKGLLRPVVGSRASLKKIEEVREVTMTVYKGKGGLGKTVIDVVEGTS